MPKVDCLQRSNILRSADLSKANRCAYVKSTSYAFQRVCGVCVKESRNYRSTIFISQCFSRAMLPSLITPIPKCFRVCPSALLETRSIDCVPTPVSVVIQGLLRKQARTHARIKDTDGQQYTINLTLISQLLKFEYICIM